MRGRGDASHKSKNMKLAEEYKASCPTHRHKDLDALIKRNKGNKEKISEQIQLWWDEPEPVIEEETWENVGKKTTKKQQISKHHYNGGRDRDNSGRDRDNRDNSGRDRESGGRDRDSGGGGSAPNGSSHGRGGSGGGRGGFRDRDRDRGGRGGGRGVAAGRGAGGSDRRNRDRDAGRKAPVVTDVLEEKKENGIPGPAPVKSGRPLQGAWGQRAAAPAPPIAPTSTPPSPPKPVTAAAVLEEPIIKATPPEPDFDVGVVSAQDPTPAGFVDTVSSPPVIPPITIDIVPAIPKPTASISTGNVWATKGSAHIIQAGKPKPPQLHQEHSIDVIQPLPVTTEAAAPTPIVEMTLAGLVNEDLISQPTVKVSSNTLDNELPPSVNGANINAAGWEPMTTATTDSTSDNILQPSPVGPVSVVSSASAMGIADTPLLDATSVPVQETISSVSAAAVASAEPVKPSSALNFGHWETGDGEDSLTSHEFGFGNFGQENDVASVDETTISSSAAQPTSVAPNKATATEPSVSSSQPSSSNGGAQPGVSPARPPPGLGLGMPPIPADKIVHVHELENKLESASLAATKKDDVDKVDNHLTKSTTADNKGMSSDQYSQNAHAGMHNVGNEAFVQMPPAGIMSQQSYTGQYGMGMYSYNGQNPTVATPNGFMGVHTPTGPVISGGVLPQQQKQQNVTGQQQGLHQQPSLYGAPVSSNANTVASDSNTNSDSTTPSNPTPNNAGMPPGMPAAMPQYQPALFYGHGQQPYQMGQHHGVGAYGFAAYGGQYGGVQGGFGYQQVMGQGGGYGQPYDDQVQQQQVQQHHGNNTNTHQGHQGHQQGGYTKNSGGGGGGGGYRGRNNHNNHHNHHNHNQYQSGYNSQGHQAYGGQPYNMGYNDFNQRGGYGPGGHMDPSYMQNSGGYQSGGGFNQEESQQMGKGKSKGGNNRNNFGRDPNVQQYQQGGQSQQFGGLQGSGTSGGGDNNGSNGLGSNQYWGGGTL